MKWFKKKDQSKGINAQQLHNFLQTQPDEKRENMQALINHMADIHERAYKKGYNDAYKINITVWAIYFGVILVVSIFKGHLI